MAEADLLFLQWMRRGASRALLNPSASATTPIRKGVGSTQVSLTINDHAPLVAAITVMGPGHVTGLDARQIIRTDPAPGSRTFEPNFFPLIELDEPSLPWLFTPIPSAAGVTRLLPWLRLVVVRKRPGVRLDPPQSGPLPVLRISDPARPADELPDLDSSWAWAHAQVTLPATTDEVGNILEHGTILEAAKARPERTLARLLCPRVLQPDTEYLACVVPTFDLGRKAGLGQEIRPEDEAGLALAWEVKAGDGPEGALVGPKQVELPVYYSWEFRTGAGGDFRSLAMLLRAARPEGLGIKSIDLGASGLAGSVSESQTILPLGGALRALGSGPAGWPNTAMQQRWEAALRPVLNAPSIAAAEQDPLLAPPLYGAAQAGLTAVDAQRPQRWFEQLNLNPAHRAVAQLGTRVVRVHQDALMASAWVQAAELRKVNQFLRQAQFAGRLAASLHRRHIMRMEAGAGLQALAPAQARMSTPAGVLRGSRFAELLQATGLEPAAYATALRRVARPRGALGRHMRRVIETAEAVAPRPASLLKFLLPQGVAARPARPAGGPVSLELVASSLNPRRFDIHWHEANAVTVASAPGQPDFAFVPLGAHVPVRPGPGQSSDPPPPPPPGSSPGKGQFGTVGLPKNPKVGLPTGPFVAHNSAASLFRAIAIAHLERFNPPPSPIGVSAKAARKAPGENALADSFAEAVALTRPQQSFAIRARAMVTGPERTDERALDPVSLSPVFPQPMIEPLSEIAQDLVLPGLDRVPPNSVVPLETNEAFVEAYMIGLNTELGRELVWRGYPANLRTTYFDRFWNNSLPQLPPDIPPIAGLGDRSLSVEASAANFVLLVRSELLRRFPSAVITAHNRTTSEERFPIFTGGFAPDVRFIGFDIPVAEIGSWTVVIQEHPAAPRFGLRNDHSETALHLSPPADDAATIAKELRVRPVRISLPPSMLTGES